MASDIASCTGSGMNGELSQIIAGITVFSRSVAKFIINLWIVPTKSIEFTASPVPLGIFIRASLSLRGGGLLVP